MGNQQNLENPRPTDATEIATRWGLVILALVAAIGALLRMFGSDPPVAKPPEQAFQQPAVQRGISDRLDETTLLYLGAAGGLLLLRQVKVFSLGQLKLEMIEKIVEQQQQQKEQIDVIQMLLPLVLPEQEVQHVLNLSTSQTSHYQGQKSLREELRRLCNMKLLKRRDGRSIGEIRDGMTVDLADYLELNALGRDWAKRIQEIQRSAQESAPTQG